MFGMENEILGETLSLVAISCHTFMYNIVLIIIFCYSLFCFPLIKFYHLFATQFLKI